VRNVIAIAGKELRGYFASPIAYIVLGIFALIFGYFFYVPVIYFNRQSMQMAMGMGQSMNMNTMLITPVFVNSTVVMLFLLPAITMRTYAEEKRSGTIELLLTSPITDTQIILGKFLGAMGLYCSMLALTLVHLAILFWFAEPNPEWKPIASTSGSC
jgi:ABC-2 type transport system permease protein